MSRGTYYQTLVHPDNRVEVVAGDDDGGVFNQYVTLLDHRAGDFHMSFNERDSELHIVFDKGGEDAGFCVRLTAEELGDLGRKILSMSGATVAGGAA